MIISKLCNASVRTYRKNEETFCCQHHTCCAVTRKYLGFGRTALCFSALPSTIKFIYVLDLSPLSYIAGALGQISNYFIGPSPFGGLGVFATRLVCTGDLIVPERPLPILPRAFKRTAMPGSKGLTKEEMNQVTMHGDEKYLGIAVERMTDEIREAFIRINDRRDT